jgi:tetratricopeptide (TPR) repeat protein
MLSRELIARLPKAELHTHLDGCLRPSTMIDLARAAKIELPSTDAEALGRFMVVRDARDLEDYLKRFDITVALLQTPEALERVAYEMVEDAAADRLRYLEVRYCPHLSTHAGLTMDEVVAAESRGLKRGERDFGVLTGIINCSLRHYSPERSSEIAEHSVRCKPLGVVAFDLAGGEAGRPPGVHGDAFDERFLARHPLRYVATYEDGRPRQPSASRAGAGDFDAEGATAQLRALGYVGDDPASADASAELTSPEQLNNHGRLLLDAGDLDGALADFERASALAPEESEALINSAAVHLLRGRRDLALRAYTEALQRNPNDVGALLQLAALRASEGQLAAAEAHYRQALRIEDRLPGPYIGLGDLLLRAGHPEEALELFEAARDLDPRNADALYDLGVTYVLLGRDDEARAAYERALTIAPESSLILNNLGDLELRNGRQDEALGLFRRAARADPRHVESRFNVGSVLLEEGRASEALPWLTEAVALAPDLEPAQERLARAHLASGAQEEARRRFEMMVRMFPASAAPCVELARMAAREGRVDEAALWLRHALDRGGEGVRPEIEADPALRALAPER